MDTIYKNPLHQTALKGAIRVLKRLAVEASDEVLAKLVKQIEDRYLQENDNEQEDERHL